MEPHRYEDVVKLAGVFISTHDQHKHNFTGREQEPSLFTANKTLSHVKGHDPIIINTPSIPWKQNILMKRTFHCKPSGCRAAAAAEAQQEKKTFCGTN